MPEEKTSSSVPSVQPRTRREHNTATLSYRILLFGIAAVVTAFLVITPTFNFASGPFCSLRDVLNRVHAVKIQPIFLTSLCFGAGCIAQPSSVDAYLGKQVPLSKAGVLANIGPDGFKSLGAKAGVVIASPSTSDPDYLYTWTRDAALVLKALIQQFTTGGDATLRDTIDNYVVSQTILQGVTNPSGTISTGGLGEPKFHINLTAFADPWGRPQRDGPALRATALIQYANWLIANGNISHVTDKIWPIIRLDLDYTAANWNQTGFDLWEEVSSSSFFTTAVQLRALNEGAKLAMKLDQSASVTKYNQQIPNVYCFLQSYWNPVDEFVTSNTGGGRSGKDANSVLASTHNFDAGAGCDASSFQPCSDRALANHKAYVDAFRSIYTINEGIASGTAVATGRYPEDIYYNGNPWYLTTLAAAEQLYDALTVWSRLDELNITATSLSFFRQFSPSITVGTYHSSASIYVNLTSAIRDYADGFVAVAAKYTPSSGALAEQYDRNTGIPLSAKDLTWSYAALLTANAARNGFAQDGWGAAELAMPETCSENSGATVMTTFHVNATTVFGEEIYITGSIDALGNWSPDRALLLSSKDYPTWSLAVHLPADMRFEYKYIRKNHGNVDWESDPNRLATTPASGSYTIRDTWR